eukprot:4672695-Prymnesium_polylepis.2
MAGATPGSPPESLEPRRTRRRAVSRLRSVCHEASGPRRTRLCSLRTRMQTALDPPSRHHIRSWEGNNRRTATAAGLTPSPT